MGLFDDVTRGDSVQARTVALADVEVWTTERLVRLRSGSEPTWWWRYAIPILVQRGVLVRRGRPSFYLGTRAAIVAAIQQLEPNRPLVDDEPW
jgi:hypothetical protein